MHAKKNPQKPTKVSQPVPHAASVKQQATNEPFAGGFWALGGGLHFGFLGRIFPTILRTGLFDGGPSGIASGAPSDCGNFLFFEHWALCKKRSMATASRLCRFYLSSRLLQREQCVVVMYRIGDIRGGSSSGRALQGPTVFHPIYQPCHDLTQAP